MLYALICRDRPDAFPIRRETRAAHLDYLGASGMVQLAGPFIEGDKPTGSLLIIEAADRAAAEAFAASDPYAQAGLFAEVTIREWKKVIG